MGEVVTMKSLENQLFADTKRRAHYFRLAYCRDRVLTGRLSWADMVFRLQFAGDQMVHIEAYIPGSGWIWMSTKL